MMKGTNKNIGTKEAVERINKGFDCMDEYRTNGLESATRVQTVKYGVKEREAQRLELKYGSNSPQVVKARAKIKYADITLIGIQEQSRRVNVDVPPINFKGWRVQGRVVNTKFEGLPNLTVALYDDKGHWIEGLGQSCTNENGAYVLSANEEDKGKLIERLKGQSLFLSVSDQNQQVLHRERRPVVLQAGKITNRLIILGDSECSAPPVKVGNDDPGKPTPEVSAEDVKTVTVKGTIKNAKGKDLKGMKVGLFDKEGQFEKLLGTVSTDDKGNFIMSYTEKEHKELFDKNPKLHLRALDTSGKAVYTSRKAVQPLEGKEHVFNVKLSKRK